MQAPYSSSDKGHYVPGNPLEKMAKQLLTELRGYGPTDEEREASAGEELTATIPQGKRPQSHSATSQDGPTTAEIEAAVQRVNDLHHGTAKR